MQDDIQGVFAAADKAANGTETGIVKKADARLALEAYLKVGPSLLTVSWLEPKRAYCSPVREQQD